MNVKLPPPPGLALGRYCKAIAMGRGERVDTVGYAEGCHEAWKDTPETLLAFKAAVLPLTTSTFGGMAAAQVYDLLLPAIRAQELLSRIPNLRRVPLNVMVPAISIDVSAHLVAEGVAKPLSRFTTAMVTVTPRKVVADVCVTRELLQLARPDAESALAIELARAVAVERDRAFANGDFAGSIAAGATSINSTGSTLAAIDADLASLVAALIASGDNALNSACWILSGRAAIYLASLRGSGGALAYPGVTAKGGVLLGLPVFTSSGLNSNDSPSESQILLLDAAQILVADSGEAQITLAREADVELSDTPTSAATTRVSLFQTNLVVLRAELSGWARQSTSSVIVLDNVQFG